VTIYYSEFPNLRDSNHRPTSDPTSEENCIAHAIGACGEWWEPVFGRIWPAGAPYYNYKIESLVYVYERLGFIVCESSEWEPEFEKIAIYGKDGVYTHAARQLPKSVAWTSKLGPDDDISHTTLDVLVGGSYGTVVKIMKRPRRYDDQTKCCEAPAEPAQQPDSPSIREDRRGDATSEA
jgi:hypothetical protein